ncbi:hypothetical protein D3C75_1002030 [compost metagenome]
MRCGIAFGSFLYNQWAFGHKSILAGRYGIPMDTRAVQRLLGSLAAVDADVHIFRPIALRPIFSDSLPL